MIKLTEDKLDRGQVIDKLFALFDNFGNQGDRGFTMILNGKYGSGKSTLLSFIEEKNSRFDIIKYNAWENNFFENPLFSILYEISKSGSKSSKIRDGAKKVIKNIPLGLVKSALNTVANITGVDAAPLLPDGGNVFEEYDRYKESLNKFRTALAEKCKIKKTLFLIDELDRCLPEYQIKVLEAVYHLFEIPDLIVVIALDRAQLECSITSKFGNNQNTLGYLAKFIDYQVDLPNDGDFEFVKSLMNFNCNGVETDDVKSEIAKMFGVMGYSVRNCQMLVNEVNLVCNKAASAVRACVPHWYPWLAAFIVTVKYENYDLYREWFYDEESNYNIDEISFDNSDFARFMQEVKGTRLYDFIDGLRLSTTLSALFLLDIIHTVMRDRSLSVAAIANYTGLESKDIQWYRSGMSSDGKINGLIRDIKILSF